jgi:hypothetical protein
MINKRFRLKNFTSRFTEGLQKSGIWNSIQRDIAGWASQFLSSSTTPLTAKSLADLFQATLSPAGGNARSSEAETLSWWRDWLADIEGCNIFCLVNLTENRCCAIIALKALCLSNGK